MTLPTHCLIVYYKLAHPHARGLLTDAHALGVTALTQIEVADLYFIEGELSPADRERLVTELLSDPITQTAQWRSASDGVVAFRGHIIETALRPVVTDSVAEQIVHGAQVLSIVGVQRAATGKRFVLHGKLTEDDLHTLAKRLLVNPVIQRYAFGKIEPSFPQAASASTHVEIIALRELDDDELLALSRERRAALNLAEMQAIQQYYRSTGREPTDVEFETIAQTWSEHCVHKTFKAKISVQYPVSSNQYVASSQTDDQLPITNYPSPQVIDGILKTYIRAATEQINAPWVRSAFVDNAGIIDFDDEYEISFKVETHNHPSAIEPFGGANTGVGGVIRDILGVSAKPIAATDVLCFGPQDLDPDQLPEGVLHPRRIRGGVVAGIQDYGNKIGVPTVSGAIIYDEGFTSNPLVFCGCVGIAPKGSHPREPHADDRIIVIGGRTGRDGLRGATFSSMTMDAQTGEVAGASVQIGDPITEKGLIEVITRARDTRLYHAITDCGAGGFSSAVGEMAKHTGAEVDLSRVRLKYAGLAPWEIWLSEAQERMVLAVPSEHVAELQKLCDIFNVELTDIGAFNDTGRLVVRYGDPAGEHHPLKGTLGSPLLDLDNDFLHEGLPQRTLTATVQDVAPAVKGEGEGRKDFDKILLELLAHPNIASKADVIRIYDHEVQGGTVVKPLTGAMNDGPSDAVVIKPLGTKGTRGIVLSCGINVEYGKHDPYRMAVSAIDEAIRNAVAVGANPERIALLDNFCWGDPNRPETLGALVEAARGCYDAALHYRTPFISGKDSLNNEYLGSDGKRHAIPPTLLISAIGIIEDVNKAVTMDLKEVGNVVYLIGFEGGGKGGNHANLLKPPLLPEGLAKHWRENYSHTFAAVPSLPKHGLETYRNLHYAMRAGLVRACHDISEGGFVVTAAEMCIAGRLGMNLALRLEEDSSDQIFSELNGSFIVEVRAKDCEAFESYFPINLPTIRASRIGTVIESTYGFNLRTYGMWLSLSLEELIAAWQGNG